MGGSSRAFALPTNSWGVIATGRDGGLLNIVVLGQDIVMDDGGTQLQVRICDAALGVLETNEFGGDFRRKSRLS